MSQRTHRPVHPRHLPLVAAAVLLVLGTNAGAQQRSTLRKIEILGLQRLSADQVITATGLKVGDSLEPSMVDAAADKLMRSGWFQTVDYRVRTAESDTTVIFNVVEKSASPSTAAREVLGQLSWSGNTVLSSQELEAAFGLRPGDSASLANLDQGMSGVRKAYGHLGFINMEISRAATQNQLTRRTDYHFTIREGQKYRMGVLSIAGLPPTDSRLLSSQWKLAPNAIFDDSYLEQFRTAVLRPFVAERTQRTGVRSRFEINTKPDLQKHTVDVIITFK